jgi:hypothetical protein
MIISCLSKMQDRPEPGMVKVVFAALKRAKKAGGTLRKIRKKRMLGGDGRMRTVPVLDAESESFDEDLERVFQRNVSKARRDNKRLLGVVDVVPRKS